MQIFLCLPNLKHQNNVFFPQTLLNTAEFCSLSLFFLLGSIHPTFQIDVNSHSPVKKMPFQEKNLIKKAQKDLCSIHLPIYLWYTINSQSTSLPLFPPEKKKKRTLIIKAASVGIHINGEDSKDQGGNAQHHSQHWDHVVLGMPFHLVVQVVPHPAFCARISRWFNLETSYPNKLDIWISYVSLKNHEDIWNKKNGAYQNFTTKRQKYLEIVINHPQQSKQMLGENAPPAHTLQLGSFLHGSRIWWTSPGTNLLQIMIQDSKFRFCSQDIEEKKENGTWTQIKLFSGHVAL